MDSVNHKEKGRKSGNLAALRKEKQKNKGREFRKQDIPCLKTKEKIKTEKQRNKGQHRQKDSEISLRLSFNITDIHIDTLRHNMKKREEVKKKPKLQLSI